MKKNWYFWRWHVFCLFVQRRISSRMPLMIKNSLKSFLFVPHAKFVAFKKNNMTIAKLRKMFKLSKMMMTHAFFILPNLSLSSIECFISVILSANRYLLSLQGYFTHYSYTLKSWKFKKFHQPNEMKQIKNRWLDSIITKTATVWDNNKFKV